MIKEMWSKPELIVLMRNHPGEAVLAPKCKSPNGGEGVGNTYNNSCAETPVPPAVQCFNSADPS